MTNLKSIRRTSLLTLLVMLMYALSPSLAKLQSSLVRDSQSIEICTSAGTTWLNASDVGLDATEQDLIQKNIPFKPHAHAEDCPFCHLQSIFFIGTQHSFQLPIYVASLIPLLFLEAHRPLFAWVSQPARAPPSVL